MRQLKVAVPTMSVIVARNAGTLINVLKAGHCAALVLDAGAVGPGAVVAVMRLYQHFPSLPVIAVGTREDEVRLGHLISAGRIYRFLHRPLSGARTRNFLEAALRRHVELQQRSGEAPAEAIAGTGPVASRLHAPPRAVLVAGALVVVAGLALWWLWPPSPARAATTTAGIEAAPAAVPRTR